jgi:steroid delta-isomerase-like uncharacterized protein
MSADEHRTVLRRYFSDLINKRDYASADRLLAADFSFHDPAVSPEPMTREAFLSFLGAFNVAFPDYQFSVEDQIVCDDKAVARWRFTGTHRGEFLGIPPTGRAVTLTGIDIFEFAGGKIVQGWVETNVAGLLRQLGVLPG